MTIEPKFSLDQPHQINHLAPDGVLVKDRAGVERVFILQLMVAERSHPARGGNVIQLPATASVPAAGRKLRS